MSPAIAAIIGAIIALAKSSQAFDSILRQLLGAYATWKTDQNIANEKAKDARNDGAVDAAARGMPALCGTCPFTIVLGGQHGGATQGPGVSASGPSGP